MDVEIYQANYKDSFGEEKTSIYNDGKDLRMNLRGVDLIGSELDWRFPEGAPESMIRKKFNIFQGYLCSYSLDFGIPIQLVEAGKTHQVILSVHSEYGQRVEGSCGPGNYYQEHEILQLELIINNQSFITSGRSHYNTFDEQLTELKTLIPQNVLLNICWSCAYSDYFIYGSGVFGHMACFREVKDDYLKVTTKQELVRIWEKRTEYVPEIHCCSEFQKRQPGIGGLYVG